MPHPHRVPSGLGIPCTKPGCNCWFKNQSGHTQHMNAKHPVFLHPPTLTQPSVPHSPSPALASDIINFGDIGGTDLGDAGPMDDKDPLQSSAEFFGTGEQLYRNYHPLLSACPCDAEGAFFPPGTSPPPLTEKALDDWTPYKSHVKFELANYLFTKNQTPAHSIDHLLDIWAASLIQAGSKATLFPDHCNVYRTIDNTPLGDVKWQSFSVKYTGTIPDEGAPPWMADSHNVWFRDPCDVVRNMLANPDLAAEMDLQPYHEFATENNERQWQDFMSGDWGWAQADMISKDTDTHGSTFVPVILRSDKTTVSVAMGQNNYYPLYASIGNVQNNVRPFLAMPKTTKEHADTPGFRNFRHQLFHSSLSFILKNLKPAMTKPEVARFGDGHYQHVVYGLGPYIADYKEQVLLACILQNWCAKCLSHRGNLDEISLNRSRAHADALIEECDFGTLRFEYSLVGELVPFTNDFPHADIHELLAPDLLHQLIKGAYKDHLVDWVEKYLLQMHGKRQANIILDDIDQRISAVPPFPGLCRFPQGHHFKQWTGDDSKVLMKVYLPAIEGYVPTDVVHAFHALLEFIYLIHPNIITKKSLIEIQDALTHFHTYHEVFRTTGVVSTFSLPQQHSMTHYVYLIRLFGAPNSLCSSITESKHIKAAKEPWRHSSWYRALGQMLLTNQRLDKLVASHMDFCICGMLSGTCLSSVLTSLGNASVPDADVIANSEDIDAPTSILAHVELSRRKQAQSVPVLASKLHIPHLVDLELTEVPVSIMDCPHFDGRIRVFNSAVSTFFAPSDLSGIGGMKREHVCVSPKWRNGHAHKDCVFVITDPNAHRMRGMDIAQGFGDAPNNDTGMWMVKSSSTGNYVFAVIHVDTIFRSAHLIPVYGTDPLPSVIKPHHVLEIFTLFYVNKYADHHAFEIAC
ncbi:uncharacterized protein BJ212DRAFT_1450297 [Suillus subaureus]|uniref:C2H2-type domain-containing protein n=1 Tax=Suillus subaureus TaxID=48587 RepID=A0A9P7J1W4_9AGAM|nr:uncharacterized protein BJ212DRAFT_1450297 [Suillus subaureus]KAG1799081.1 hypothetical protein BJ212DRAFT_1450297 [Suillus subaureus]